MNALLWACGAFKDQVRRGFTKVRIVNHEGRDQYPHGIQLLDLAEELRRAALPALSAVETGSVIRPELRVRFGAQTVVDGEERTVPDGAVRIEYWRFDSYAQNRLDGRLIFIGLKGALSDLQLVGTSCWSAGRDSELALRVGLVEPTAPESGHGRADDELLGAEEAAQAEWTDVEGYSPEGVDRRALVERQIRERRGQRQFRDAVRDRYGNRCLVTGCEVLAVLEAAHVSPYRGERDHHPENGLLRSDVHTLFDLDLLGIEPERLQVELHPDVAKEYGHLAGVTLNCPSAYRPSREALSRRYERFRQRLHRPA
jgi:hypothetical protein